MQAKCSVHSIALIILLLSAYITFIPVSQADESDPWLEGWLFRQEFTFTADQDNCQANFSMPYAVSYANSTRITENDGTTLIPIYIDSANNIWAKYPLANVTYYLYWGNGEASTISNATAVFEDVIGNVVLGIPMDEGEGSTVQDYSGNNNNGIIYGAEWVETGHFGTALEFDGTGNYIQLASKISLPSAFSVFTWWKRLGNSSGTVDTYHYLLRAYNGDWHAKGLCVSKAGTSLYTTMYNGTAEKISVISMGDAGVEHFCGAFWNGVETYAMVDKVKDSPTTAVSAISSGSDASIIGRWSDTAHMANGTISGMYVFDDVLSDSEIDNVYAFYPDCKIIEGSVCCRVWLTLSAFSFGTTEAMESELTVNDAVLIGVLALVIALCGFAYVSVKKD